MIRAIDVAWAAGFLEGEGSFLNYGTPQVTAAQVEKEPIDRLIKLFGGRTYQRHTNGHSFKPIWVWKVPAYRAVEIMMTVYSLMSPKRQEEIRAALEKWKAARLFKRKDSAVCGRGHEMTGYNVVKRGSGVRCRACQNMVREQWRARVRERDGACRV